LTLSFDDNDIRPGKSIYNGRSFCKRLKKLEKTFDQHGLHKHTGKSCIRFTKTSDIPLKDIMSMLANISPADYLRIVEKARSK